LSPYDTAFMPCLLSSLAVFLIRIFRFRGDLLLENLALRQQLFAMKRRYPRPKVTPSDKLFWVILRRLWPEWKRALILVQPETVVRWHRAGFKLYWAWISRRRVRAGRKCVSKELRDLIFRMVAENTSSRRVAPILPSWYTRPAASFTQ
jgi:putative transposase